MFAGKVKQHNYYVPSIVNLFVILLKYYFLSGNSFLISKKASLCFFGLKYPFNGDKKSENRLTWRGRLFMVVFYWYCYILWSRLPMHNYVPYFAKRYPVTQMSCRWRAALTSSRDEWMWANVAFMVNNGKMCLEYPQEIVICSWRGLNGRG